VGRDEGVRDEQILALARHRESTVFDELETLVLDYAEALTQTPANASDSLISKLREHLDDEQWVELTTAIAWENFRARFNRGFDVGQQGFSEGAVCALPQHANPVSDEP